MGSSSSKPEKHDALHLCKARMRFMRQATESRYALSAAHLAYLQSLRNIGSALRRFAEAEMLTESSLSTAEPEKSPSPFSYAASPSPSQMVESSPFADKNSPISPRVSNISCMRSGESATVTVKIDPSLSHFVDEESLTSPLPPPPPPPPDVGSSWDFFNPADSTESLGLHHAYGFSNLKGSTKEGEVVVQQDDPEPITTTSSRSATANTIEKLTDTSLPQIEKERDEPRKSTDNSGPELLSATTPLPKCSSELEKIAPEKVLRAEREDPSEFITHRAKNFASSIKDIEHRFFKAAESGSEVSRMLEANKIRLEIYLDNIGKSSPSLFSCVNLSCCKGGFVLDQESTQNMAKIITRDHSMSSLSSSSKNPLRSSVKDDCDSGSDFMEEFCMISGSHSSTLDRLYAWERKLYDEVKSTGLSISHSLSILTVNMIIKYRDHLLLDKSIKQLILQASRCIRKEYDRQCCQLRHQFARDVNPKVIDKTRAIIKDLHSQVRVILQTVDSIAKRIERLRDEELLPQLVELIQGSIRMWKAMLASHHSQYITISLAYHVKVSTAAHRPDAYRQVLINLQNEMEWFASSFTIWIDAHKSYVEALNAWLQNCILQRQERSTRGRRTAFSPRRALAPPIFVLCRDWIAGIKSLPSEDLSNAIRCVILELHSLFPRQKEEKQTRQKEEKQTEINSCESNVGRKKDEVPDEGSNLQNLQTSLTRTFDCMTKFAEASLKMYEEIKQSTETARVSYANASRMRYTV